MVSFLAGFSNLPTKLSKSFMANIFYVYGFLRETDNTPYYIGKGKGNRAYSKERGVNPPKNKDKIVFLRQRLTEEKAFEWEMFYIKRYGRKDIGTGILRNRTNGGEGASGAVRSKETRQKMGDAQRGEKNHRFGKSPSQETQQKLSEVRRRENLSQETLQKMSEAHRGEKNPTSNWWKITFEDGKVITQCGLPNWAKENGYSQGHIHKVYTGKRKRHKDIVKVEKIPPL